MTSRKYDENGWMEVKGNPLTKVGIFDYSGGQIDPDGELGLDHNKIYKVYRAEEVLKDPECLESFKLIPFIDEHVMLGNGKGLVPAEEKGVQGVVGEDVYFEDGYLKGNLKIFSKQQFDKIKNGKKELSIGYDCKYYVESGYFKEMPYDLVQRNIRANHVALVNEGRAGPDVRVLDRKHFTFDSMELNMPDITIKEGQEKEKMSGDEMPTLESLSSLVKGLVSRIEKLETGGKETKDEDIVEEEEEVAEDRETAEPIKTAGENKESEIHSSNQTEKPGDKAMDEKLTIALKDIEQLKKRTTKELMAEISQRDNFANTLSKQIGVFDHADKTIQEVAEYGIKKLKISCAKGQEIATINGYLQARIPNNQAFGFDSNASEVVTNPMDAYFNEEIQ